jgi:hypothetical protein
MKNEFEIRGDKVAIFLNRKDGQNIETIVDLVDLNKLKSFDCKWYATTKKNIDSYYVNGSIDGFRKTIYLHRFLMDAPKKFSVDHINHDTLNNTRNNLRVVTHAENLQNRVARKDGYSGIRGVTWHTHHNKWMAAVRMKDKRYCGYFDSLGEAEKAVINARKEMMPFSQDARVQ